MFDDHQIFLTYAREDEPRVIDLYTKLTNAGFKVWMDKQNLLPGQKWEYQIRNALKRSQLVIVCLSFASIAKRGFLQKEVRAALERLQEKLDSDIYLIPLRMDPCEVPESLSNLQWVDLFSEDGWAQLVSAIHLSIEQNDQQRSSQLSHDTKHAKSPKHQGRLWITTPDDGGEVDARPFVRGSTGQQDAEVWVIVRPTESSSFWVQPSVSVHEGGTWTVQVYVGRQNTTDDGKHFEIRAVANPKLKLSEGLALDKWPDADQASQIIEVIRGSDERPSSRSTPPSREGRNVAVGSANRTTIVTGDKNKIRVSGSWRHKNC